MTSTAIRVGLVGAGRWATQHHVPAVVDHDRAELVGFVEPDQDREAMFASGAPGAEPFDSVEELLAHGRIDALIVASPPATHFDAAAPALRAGIATLVEKPFTIQPAQAWNLVALSRNAALVVGLTHQFTEAAVAVGEWLGASLIGRLGAISGTYHAPRLHLYRDGLDGEDSPERPHDSTELDRPLRATFSDPRLSGGGQLINQGTHILGAIVAATAAPIVAVHGAQTTPRASDDAGSSSRVEVAFGCALESADGTPITIASHGASLGVHQQILFDGTDGHIAWNLATGVASLSTAHGADSSETSTIAYPTGAPCEYLLDLVAGSTGPNRAPGALGAHLVDVVTASYRSAKCGGPVDVPYPKEWP